tara:strand:- start:202 stop:1338 length:1137 start_codon:yes stop_codon:yes gene_type:complete
MAASKEPDFTEAVNYHYEQFPPQNLDPAELLLPLSNAVAALTKYDVMLRQMRESEILLAPLRRQEAVVSSRMEGTVTTLEEVLSVEADQSDDDPKNDRNYRHEAIEVLGYSSAMRGAQSAMQGGTKISEWLIRATHQRLLRFGRGHDLKPGTFKTEQNYLADKQKKKILFVPVSPEALKEHMERLIEYIDNSTDHPLIKAAISHIEFEALHPFNDGNGRVGRMLITLYLWQAEVISAPHFYVSEYFEENRDTYIDAMRQVSQHNDWTSWVVFFLNGLAVQAETKCKQISEIQELYIEMQDKFRDVLSSKDYLSAVNFVFEQPVFRSSRFISATGLARPTATRFLRLLRDAGLIRVVEAGSGRRAALYAFDRLLETVRA